MSPAEQVRVFIAVPIVPELRDAASALRRHLNSAADVLRWVPPGNLHFTLKFLGEIAPHRLTPVADAVREAARRTRPFTITLAGAGAFPSPKRPQVVWVGVSEGSDTLVALAGDLDAALQRLKFPREHRPFRPHLTVARAKHGGTVPDLSRVLSSQQALTVGSQVVDALVVMESQLHPSGATYRPIEEVGLGEAA